MTPACPKLCVRLLGGMTLLLNAPIVLAQLGQAYPSRAIRVIVPFTPAGGLDVLARLIAQKMTEGFGEKVYVENRPGANGNIGMELVAKSPADGYTLLLSNFTSFVVNPNLYPKMPYDTVKDFAPVALLIRNPYIFVAHPALPVKSVKDLIALAKGRNGQLAFSSSGNGSGAHLSGATLNTMAGIDMVHVPYKGAAPGIIDTIAGQVQLSFTVWNTAGPHVKTRRLRALAVTTEKRSPALPDLPAISETVPGYDMTVWYGVVAPSGTPAEIIAKLNSEISSVLLSSDFRKRIEADAGEPLGGTPEQFGNYIKTELVKWAKVIKDSGAKID